MPSCLVSAQTETAKRPLNGRLFAPPAGEGRTHNIGSTAGKFWQHPGLTYDQDRPTWITEGILDALSLIEIGHQAIAVLSAGQDPAKVDLSAFPKKAFAFDNDEAGHSACRTWKTAYPDAEVILCDQGHDWNDLLQVGSLTRQGSNLMPPSSLSAEWRIGACRFGQRICRHLL